MRPGVFTGRSLAVVLLGCLLWAGAAPTHANPAESSYAPKRGQPGKDVVWIPTPQGLIDRMLDAAKVTSRDLLFDLGSGDGIIPITAARRHGAQAVGIEYNPQLADFARRKVAEAGVADQVRIITGDIFKEDFSAATVVTLYLYPDLNMRLRPSLLAMKPGTRVVSHAFSMGDWEPDEVLTHSSSRGYLWIVPAQVEGEWVLSGLSAGSARLQLQQTFQHIGGLLILNDVSHPLVGATLRGSEIRFKIIAPTREVQEFSARVVGSRIEGTFNGSHLQEHFTGRRR